MTEPSQRQLLNLAIPNMLGALAVPLAELVSLSLLGRDGHITDLSGVVLATVIFDYLFWTFAFLRMGTTGLVAQAAARGDTDEQANLFWRGVVIAAFFGIAITLLQRPIAAVGFSLLAGDADVHIAGQRFYDMMIWGAAPLLVNYVCIGWLLGRQQARSVMGLSFFWQCANISLSLLFILQLDYGAAGAGLALTLADWLAMLVALTMVWREWGGVPPYHRDAIFHWQRLKPLIVLNGSIVVRTFLLISVLAAFTNLSALFGTVTLAANAILLRLFVTAAYVIDGFAIALETLAGHYSGPQKRVELNRAFRLTMRWNAATVLVFLVVYGLFAAPLLSLINDNPTIVAVAADNIPWLLVMIVAGGIAFTYDGLFLGLAQAGLLFRSMMQSALCFIPFAIVAWVAHSERWLWAAIVAFTIARAVTLAIPARRRLFIGAQAVDE